MASEIKIGSYTGDGAAQNVILGFKPHHVRVVNTTDGTFAWEWFDGMTDGHALQSNTTGDNSRITANGISAYDGDSSNAPGFTIGTALSTSGKTFRYIATRNVEY